MARNSEKAMTTLARWRAAQLAEASGGKSQPERRPYLASECDDLQKALKFRIQIIREVAKKVSQIQNAGLGEFRIRDLNDEINKLLREKRHWEIRIKELGGPNFNRYGPKMLDHEGKEVPGNRGYKYFGAARDLPGVRELFEQEPPPPPRKTRAELMKDIDADYYGYRDDDDGILLPLEQEQETVAVQAAVNEWKEKKAAGLLGKEIQAEEDIYGEGHQLSLPSTTQISAVLEDSETAEDPFQHQFIAHVPVPSQQDIEQALLERKKRELLSRYVGDEDVQMQENTGSLNNAESEAHSWFSCLNWLLELNFYDFSKT